MKGYKVEIIGGSREFSKLERISFKDTSDVVSIVDACGDDKLEITVVDFVLLHIVNPHSKKETEYDKFVLITDTGDRFVTGSESFIDTFTDIWFDMQDEPDIVCPVTIQCYIKESRNNPQGFLTCRLVVN